MASLFVIVSSRPCAESVAMMAEEERRRLEKKAAEGQQSPLHDTYQQLPYEQPSGRSIIGWIVIGIIIIIVLLLIRN